MKYTYLVQLNCKGVKMGKKTFRSEKEMEDFEKEMIRKYARNEDDLVVVMFR